MKLPRIATTLPLLIALLAPSAAPAQEERPSAMQLFPSETVLWLRAADAGLLVERLQQTSLGQLYRDPDMADFADRLSSVATDAYTKYAQEFIEADLQDLLNLPQGEVAFGLIHRPDSSPGLLLVADFGDQAQVAQLVVERIETLAEEQSNSVTTEQLRSDEAKVVRDGNNQERSIAMVRRDTTFVFSNDRDVLQSALDRWDGIRVEEGYGPVEDETEDEAEDAAPLYAEPLASSAVFSATLRELLPGSDEPPQAVFFIDPIGMLKAAAGRQTAVRAAMLTFPALGVDGIQAFGGAMWLATDKWDSLTRGHLLLDNPRSGVLKIARLETGEIAPPDFIPSDLENLISIRVDPVRMFDDIAALVDRFRYDGSFRNLVENNLSENLGTDFEQDLVGVLDGRIFYMTGYDESGQLLGAKAALALGVTDPDAAQAALDRIAEKNSRVLEEASYGAASYYSVLPPRLRERPPSERPVSPAVATLGDALILTESDDLFKQMVDAHEGQRPRLQDSLEHRLIFSRLKRLAGGQPFSAVGYHDSEAMLRHFHQAATSDDRLQQIEALAEENPFFASLRDLLDEGSLPPLETLLRYSGPSGSMVIDTNTGWHMVGFSFKPAAE